MKRCTFRHLVYISETLLSPSPPCDNPILTLANPVIASPRRWQHVCKLLEDVYGHSVNMPSLLAGYLFSSAPVPGCKYWQVSERGASFIHDILVAAISSQYLKGACCAYWSKPSSPHALHGKARGRRFCIGLGWNPVKRASLLEQMSPNSEDAI